MTLIVYDLQTNKQFIKHVASIRKVEHPKANGAIAKLPSFFKASIDSIYNIKRTRTFEVEFVCIVGNDVEKKPTQASPSKRVWVRDNAALPPKTFEPGSTLRVIKKLIILIVIYK